MPRGKKATISLVCPCFNEAEGIAMFYQELQESLSSLAEYEFQLVFIDDGSTDATLEILNELSARDERVEVYSLSRNFGHQIALTAGIDVAGGEAVVMMDSDLQHPPEVIPRMITKWEEGADIVSAVRKDTSGASIFKKLSAAGFYAIFNFLSDTKLVAGAADFCLLSRPAYVALRQMPERHRFLRGMLSWMGFTRAFVEFEAPHRAAGVSKYSLRRMVAMALDAIFQFSTKPIRMATRTGVVFIVIGLVYLVYVLFHAIVSKDAVQGWPSLICLVLVLGGLQLAFIGIIGEYLGRIFEQTKARPLYLFKQQGRKKTTPLVLKEGRKE